MFRSPFVAIFREYISYKCYKLHSNNTTPYIAKGKIYKIEDQSICIITSIDNAVDKTYTGPI